MTEPEAATVTRAKDGRDGFFAVDRRAWHLVTGQALNPATLPKAELSSATSMLPHDHAAVYRSRMPGASRSWLGGLHMIRLRMSAIFAVLASPALASLPAAAQPASAQALGEAHARSAMTDFGCASISSLSPGPAGSWHGQCSKGGRTVNVMMDGKGVVTSGSATQHMTEAHARSAMTAYGCSNISHLAAGPGGSWHGLCSKGGQTVNVAMDATGTVTSGTAPQHLTDGNARAILTNYGCASISGLSASSDGGWVGQCSKGGKTITATVDSAGAVTSR